MNDRSDSNGRTEGLAPVHYLFGAGPSGSAETEAEASRGSGRGRGSAPRTAGWGEPSAPSGTDGERWFDPELDERDDLGTEDPEGTAAPDPSRTAARTSSWAPTAVEGSTPSAGAPASTGSWAVQRGERGLRALRPVGETPDDRYGAAHDANAAADGTAADGTAEDDAAAAESARRERDEGRRRQRDERAAERSARRAENVTMHALTRRGQSVQEVRDLLTARELDADEIEVEIERLSGVGLLDDADLAQNLVRTLTERKKLGRSALVSELRRRKLDPLAIEEAVAELDRDDEDERCLELARQRARQLNSVDEQTAERRLSAFLQRKGYSGDAIRKAVRTALRDERGVRFV